MSVCMVQNFTVNECGPVHITIGDGGNIEGLSEFKTLCCAVLCCAVLCCAVLRFAAH